MQTPVRHYAIMYRKFVRTFQADCGSIKGAGVPAEEGTGHYIPC